MTDAANSSAPSNPARPQETPLSPPHAPPAQSVLLQQARLLNQSAPNSCRTVQLIVIFIGVVLYFSTSAQHAFIWVSAASFMVFVTYAYSRWPGRAGITADNYQRYLTGHTIVSGLTGLTWSGFACYLIQWDDPLSIVIAGAITTIIPVGGMLPGAMYRREYVVLASCTLLPFGAFILLTAPVSLKAFGLATGLYYVMCLASSARAESDTRDGIMAREMQSMSQRLAEQNARIEKSNRARMRFLQATSHDFSQPLQAQGYFIHALRNLLTSPDQIRLLDGIEASWTDQAKLLEGIVSITKIDSGVIKTQISPVNLATHARMLGAEYQIKSDQKRINFETDFTETYVLTDPILLSRIIRNLLSNAIKFAPPGGTVTFITHSTDDHVILSISDTGPGISAADLDRVFDEYVQLDTPTNSDEKGLGLGLSIVRRLVDLLGIEMKIDSALGRGTKFALTLPRCEPIHDNAPIALNPQAAQWSNALIVIVEDELHIRESMSILITNWGCQVIACATGDEAIHLLNETDALPDLFIIDKRLAHGEDGTVLITRLRDEVNEDVPAVIMTGEIMGLEALADSIDVEVYTKPVHASALRALLERRLGAPSVPITSGDQT